MPPPPSTQDWDALFIAARGDSLHPAWPALQQEILGICRGVTKNLAAADDLAQDVFDKAWRTADSFAPARAPWRTWIGAMARSRWIELHRRKRTAQMPVDADGRSYENNCANPKAKRPKDLAAEAEQATQDRQSKPLVLLPTLSRATKPWKAAAAELWITLRDQPTGKDWKAPPHAALRDHLLDSLATGRANAEATLAQAHREADERLNNEQRRVGKLNYHENERRERFLALRRWLHPLEAGDLARLLGWMPDAATKNCQRYRELWPSIIPEYGERIMALYKTEGKLP